MELGSDTEPYMDGHIHSAPSHKVAYRALHSLQGDDTAFDIGVRHTSVVVHIFPHIALH